MCLIWLTKSNIPGLNNKFSVKYILIFLRFTLSPEILSRQSESTNSAGTTSHSTSSRPSSPPPESHAPFMTSEPSSNLISIHERSYIQCKFYVLIVYI